MDVVLGCLVNETGHITLDGWNSYGLRKGSFAIRMNDASETVRQT